LASCLKVGRKVSRRLQARQPLVGALAAGHRVAEKLVFAKLRASFGGKIRFMISGGAPLHRDIAEFFHAAGLLILEGYGLTETSPVISVNRVDSFKFGTVGRVIPGVEVRIAEDGEILARGPSIMKEYYNRPEETAQAIDVDGWFHTGDVGNLDDDGFLFITDRKKAIIVTAGGNNVAPAAIENALVADEFISQGIVYGDARKFLSALIVPHWERIEKYALEHKVTFASRAELVGHPVVTDLIQRRIETAMEAFAPYERVKKFKLLEKEFSQEDGEVTPTLKVKRKEITKRYLKDLDSLYQD
jgi:long-chain acyl-CoA synthetase